MISTDELAIINTVNYYPIAVDSLRIDLFDDIFTTDCFVDFGGPAQWHDLESLKRDFVAIHQPYFATQHTTSNHRTEIDGDTGRCISYVHACFVREVEGGDNMFQVRGWYDDELVRTADGWRIAQRINRSICAEGNPVVMQTMPGVTVELQHHALSAEARAGNVDFLNALKAK